MITFRKKLISILAAGTCFFPNHSVANDEDLFLAYIADEETFAYYKNNYILDSESFDRIIDLLIEDNKIAVQKNELGDDETVIFPFVLELNKRHFVSVFDESKRIVKKTTDLNIGVEQLSLFDQKPAEVVGRDNVYALDNEGKQLTDIGPKSKEKRVDERSSLIAEYMEGESINGFKNSQPATDVEEIDNLDAIDSQANEMSDEYAINTLTISREKEDYAEDVASIALENIDDLRIIDEPRIRQISNEWAINQGYFDFQIISIDRLEDVESKSINIKVSADFNSSTLQEIKFSDERLKVNSNYWERIAGLSPGVVVNKDSLSMIDEVMRSENISDYRIDLVDQDNNLNRKNIVIDVGQSSPIFTEFSASYDQVNHFQIGSSLNFTNLFSVADTLSASYNPGSALSKSSLNYTDNNVFSLYDRLELTFLNEKTDFVAFSDDYDEYSIKYRVPFSVQDSFMTFGLSYSEIGTSEVRYSAESQKQYAAEYVNTSFMLTGYSNSLLNSINTDYSVSLSSSTSVDSFYSDVITAGVELSSTFESKIFKNLAVNAAYKVRSYLEDKQVPERFGLTNTGIYRNRGVADYSLSSFERDSYNESADIHQHFAFKLENKLFDFRDTGAEITAFIDQNYIYGSSDHGGDSYTSAGLSLKLSKFGLPIEVSIASLLGSKNAGAFISISAI